MSFGQSSARVDRGLATLLHRSCVRSVLRWRRRPRRSRRSSASTLSMCAAIALAPWRSIFSAAMMERRAAHRRGARAAGAFAEEHLVGVALDVLRCRSGSTPSRSQTICLNAVSWPWPWVFAPENKSQRAVAVEADFGAFEAGARGALDGVGDADAAQLAALGRLRLARLEARPRRRACSARSMFFSNSPQS